MQAIGSCVPVFLMVGAAYILALAVVHRLVPRRQPVRVEQPA
ncbi:Putative membrane protein (fragment) [Xanthomonas citri pv. bilvae]